MLAHWEAELVQKILSIRMRARTESSYDKSSEGLDPGMSRGTLAMISKIEDSKGTMRGRNNWSGASAASLMSPWQGKTS
ncbi:hypothetical protein LXL04_029461 [Taraxacum kok-saghyz]